MTFSLRILTTIFCTQLLAPLAIAETRQLPDNVKLEGTFSQGGMVIGKCVTKCQAAFDEKSLTVTPKGEFVFGFGRDAVAKHTLTITEYGNTPKTSTLAIAQRTYDIQRVTGVPQNTVTPPPEVMDRIRREQALVNEARAINSERTDFLTGFVWPIKGRISGIYGSQRFYNGQPGNPHFGLDISAPVGAEIHAPMSGKVRLAESDLYFSGGTVILDHGHGIFSSYIHMSKVIAKNGQEIKKGELLGLVGATGRAAGPHLDWRINWFSERLDPAFVVPPQ